MSTYYFWTDGVHLWPTSQVRSGVVVPPGWSIPQDASEVAWDTTDTPSATDVWANPGRYAVASGKIIAVPYFTTTQSTTSGTTTLTVTLANPPDTPPTSITATVGTSTVSLPLTNGTATLAVQVHPTLSGHSLPVAFSAPGVVGATAAVGTGPQAPVGIQALPPTTSGDPTTIAPVGPGSLDYVMGFAAGSLSIQQQMNALSVAVAVLFHLAFNDLVPQASATTWSPLTLSTDAQNALSQVSVLLPDIVPVLDTVHPASGGAMPVWSAMLDALKAAQPAFADTNTWVAAIPGLQ